MHDYQGELVMNHALIILKRKNKHDWLYINQNGVTRPIMFQHGFKLSTQWSLTSSRIHHNHSHTRRLYHVVIEDKVKDSLYPSKQHLVQPPLPILHHPPSYLLVKQPRRQQQICDMTKHCDTQQTMVMNGFIEKDLDKDGIFSPDYDRPKLFDIYWLQKQCHHPHFVFNLMCVGKQLYCFPNAQFYPPRIAAGAEWDCAPYVNVFLELWNIAELQCVGS